MEEQELNEKLLIQMHHVSNHIYRQQKEARGADLMRGQGRLLRTLVEKDGVSQQELAEKIRIQPGSLSELVGKLEEKKHILRQKDEQDKRRFLIYITDEGRKVAENTLNARKKVSGEVFSLLDKKEQEELSEILDKLLKGMGHYKGR